jgi:TrpR-related protein YerC/YecD
MTQAGKASEHWDERYLADLFEALSQLKDQGEFRLFFEDLCTPAELRSMADRWRVARLLEEGLSYRLINEKTGVSTATITRVARSLTYGSDGYRMILKRQKGENS